MIHLMCGVNIKKEDWDEVKKENDPYQYIKVLANSIWNVRDLMNRCVILKKSKNRLPNRSPRKVVTPRKAAALTGCYNRFIKMRFAIKEHYSERKIAELTAEQEKYTGKTLTFLGWHINSLINYQISCGKLYIYLLSELLHTTCTSWSIEPPLRFVFIFFTKNYSICAEIIVKAVFVQLVVHFCNKKNFFYFYSA